jgi:hypothetical protein
VLQQAEGFGVGEAAGGEAHVAAAGTRGTSETSRSSPTAAARR